MVHTIGSTYDHIQLLGVASDESEDQLSREHSLGSDDQLLFSDIEPVLSSNEGTSTPKKNVFGEEEEWEVVPCSEPDDEEHLDDHHPSATEQRADATMDAEPELNASGRPKCEAAKEVSAYLQLAGESLSSRERLYFGPQGPRAQRQCRPLRQTDKCAEDAQARKLETHAPITKDPGAQSCTQPALTPVEQLLLPRFMTRSSTQVSPRLKVRKQVWKPKSDGTGLQSARRLDIVLVDGGAPNSDECLKDMCRDQDEKERKQQEKQA